MQPAGGLDGDGELRAGGELAAGDPTARQESTDGGAVASGGPAGGAGSSGGGYSDGAGRTTVDSGAAAGGLGATDGDAVEPAAVALVGEGPVAAEDAGDGSSDHAAGEGSGGAVQPELDELADPDRLRSAVEAVLLVIDTPTSAQMLAQILGRSMPEVEGALHSLRDDYDAGARGFDLREVADGWRLYSRDEFAGYVERFVLDGQRARLTQAALETLAVIAYRQPVTRSRISAIRGVSVDAVMRTLLTRGLVEECGADPDTGGGLYRTTSVFLEKMGLRSLDELPSLAPLLPDTSQLDDVELST